MTLRSEIIDDQIELIVEDDQLDLTVLLSEKGDKGDAGEASVSQEEIYGNYSETTVPSNLLPSNSWGYGQPRTVGVDPITWGTWSSVNDITQDILERKHPYVCNKLWLS